MSQHGLRRCQVNALKAMFLELEPTTGDLPKGARDIGDGYTFLRVLDKTAHPVRPCEADAFRVYQREREESVPDNYCPSVRKWARLRLPNGQIAHSAWKEELKPLEKICMARNVKVRIYIIIHVIYWSDIHYLILQLNTDGKLEFAEVWFYLCLDSEHTVALVSLYSPPDPVLLEASYYTLWACSYQGDATLKIINIKNIEAVVAVVPLPAVEDMYFVVERPGLDMAHMGGNDEVITDK